MCLAGCCQQMPHPRSFFVFKIPHKLLTETLFYSLTGSYTSTQGINVVRQDIANFISQRDGYPAVSDDIFLTYGGSEGIEVGEMLH